MARFSGHKRTMKIALLCTTRNTLSCYFRESFEACGLNQQQVGGEGFGQLRHLASEIVLG
jgi:hypothetical protein